MSRRRRSSVISGDAARNRSYQPIGGNARDSAAECLLRSMTKPHNSTRDDAANSKCPRPILTLRDGVPFLPRDCYFHKMRRNSAITARQARPSSARLMVALLLDAVLVLVVACDVGGPVSGQPSAGGPTPTSALSSTPHVDGSETPKTGGNDGAGRVPGQSGGDEQGGTNDQGGRKDQDSRKGQHGGPWLIRWLVELGPNAPVGNHNVRLDAFDGLQRGDCSHTADIAQYADGQARELYQGVGNACLAAFSNRTELWSEAQADFYSFKPEAFDFTCYDRAAYQVFADLVKYHLQDPARSFEKASGGEAIVQDTCVRMFDVQPNSGALSGGYPVTITGQNFPDPTTVLLPWQMSVPVVPEAGGTRLTFTMPAMPADMEPGEDYLTVQNEGADTALPFNFEAASGGPSGPNDTKGTEGPTEEPTANQTTDSTGQPTANQTTDAPGEPTNEPTSSQTTDASEPS